MAGTKITSPLRANAMKETTWTQCVKRAKALWR
jgi:hypothetical protein